jgi:hypothetical protein
VSHQRIEISVALAAVGTFLICGGIGMTNWVVAGFGVGLLAAGSSIFGLSAINSRAYSFVAGTGHVLRASDPTASTGHGRCHMIMIVHAKNLDGHRVKIRDDRVPISKWPGAGVNLPILVDVDDPRRVRVLWKEVPTHVQAATARAADDASYVGEPAYVAAPQSGATAYDRTGYEPTGYGEDPGGYDATGLPDDLIGGEGGTAATDEATSDSDADFDEAEVMSGSVLEFDIDPLVMPGDNRGGRRRDTDPGRRRPSPRPRRPADAAAARAEGTAVRADDGTVRADDGTVRADDGTVRADDIAVRADDADRTGGVPDGPAKPPGPRLSAGDSPDVTADPPVDKRWDIPKTAAASAAASGVTADAAGTVTPARDESVHPALWVDQAHVVTERLTATRTAPPTPRTTRTKTRRWRTCTWPPRRHRALDNRRGSTAWR